VEELKEKLAELDHGKNWIVECVSKAPYNGCWYEPNYWLLKGGDVFPLYISGTVAHDLGIDCSADKSPWLTATSLEEWLVYMDSHDRYQDWEVINPEEWELKNYNVLNAVTAILVQHEVHTPKWDCDICKESCAGLAKFLGYRGNGGVGIMIEDPCCESCFDSIRWCNSCYRYVKYNKLDGEDIDEDDEDDEDSYDEEGHFNRNFICENYDPEESEKHELCRATDEAEKFGLTGDRFLGPDGDAEGLQGICIVIATKKPDPTSTDV
jgi:hypothetical protein